MFKKIGDKINIGIKCITLLYRELIVNRTDSSKDFSTELINNVLKMISKDNNENSALGTNVIILDNIINLCHKIVNNIDTYSEEEIMDNVKNISFGIVIGLLFSGM